MSIHTAPFKDPNYILLNQRESNAISPRKDKQQGLSKVSDGYCNVCNRPTHYRNQELCHRCRNHLIRGTLFPELGELIVTPKDNHKQYKKLVTEELVDELNDVMTGRLRTRTYKNKVAKMICVYHKFFEAKGDIDIDICYISIFKFIHNVLHFSVLFECYFSMLTKGHTLSTVAK